MSDCACGQKLRWGTNLSGKRQPFNFDPDPSGNRLIGEFGDVLPYKAGDPIPEGYAGPFMPHHATCPHASNWRKKR